MSSVFFRSGAKEIPLGVLDFQIPFVDLPFVPTSIQLSLKAPSEDSQLISAYAVGELTQAGASVQFSSPIPEEGYILNWLVNSSQGMTPVGEDSLTLSYTDFFNGVKHFLGYGDAHASITDSQKREIDSYVQAGVRQFYYPPATQQEEDSGYEWSFLRPSGQVVTTPGVSTVPLPSGFGRLIGNVTFDPELYISPAIHCSEGAVRKHLSTRPQEGPPRMISARRLPSYDENGQQCEFLLYPIPDAEYVLTFMQEADSGNLSANMRPYPLGGARFSETIMESCLAVAEQRANDEMGIHTQKFAMMLASAIAQDKKFSATYYGPMSVSDLEQGGISVTRCFHGRKTFPVSYKGSIW